MLIAKVFFNQGFLQRFPLNSRIQNPTSAQSLISPKSLLLASTKHFEDISRPHLKIKEVGIVRRETFLYIFILAHQFLCVPYANSFVLPSWNNSAWGSGRTEDSREFASRTVRNLLDSRGIVSILQLNEEQQIIVQAWSVITTFYIYSDFPKTQDGRAGWARLLFSEVKKNDAPTDASSPKKLYDSHISIEESLLPALGDPYAQFLRPKEAEEAEEIEEGGEAIGVGAAFALSPAPGEQPRVIAVIPGSSAEFAGVQTGDNLLAIDGKKVGASGIDAGRLIAGPVGTQVRAEFLRPANSSFGNGDAQRFEVILKRVLMAIEPVSFRWLQANAAPGVGAGDSARLCAYLKISTFAGPPVSARVREALRPLLLHVEESPALVLDLRGNAGGSLAEAASVAETLLEIERASARRGAVPIAIAALVDQDTASAAEALLETLRSSAAVVVVGAGGARRTFGKGVAQSRFDLSDGSALLLSVTRFLPVGFAGVAADIVLSAGEPDPVARAREVACKSGRN